MPELPEVETIRLGLQKYLVGHKIVHVDVRLGKIVEGDVGNIEGSKITAVRRFGKGLVIDTSSKYSVAIHIKLTGQLVYRGPNLKEKVVLSKKVGREIPNKFTHVIFELDKKGFLYYNDIRQFGWLKIVKTEDVFSLPFFRDLGPEPFGKLTFSVFKKIISASNMPIKPLLMDQKRMSGVGNIYANDGLWLARINPQRRAGTLKDAEIKKLYDSLLTVLKAGFKYKGASELNFVNAKGEEGEYQEHTLAYGRKGKPCKNCGGEIKKIYFAGRGTFFCPNCQN